MTTRNRSSAIIVSASLLGAVLALSACQKQDAVPPTAAAAPAAPTTPPYTPPTAEQLSQMVAPIALFPDKLVAQVLAGATYPDQIVAANQWLGQNGALKGDILQAAEDKQPWDVSVKSLTMFPAVLSQMAANPDWTRSLGDAFVNDPNDVMNAIQALRLRAQQAGNLKSSSQLKVVSTARSDTVRVEDAPAPRTVYAGAPVIPPPPQTIVIESSQPDTVYVPAYNPAVVYGPPVPVYPGYAYRPPSPVANEVVVGALSFGVGVFVGEAISHHSDWGWHDWGMHWGGGGGGDRPSGDWQRPAVVYKNTTYVSHSTTVINRVTNNNVTVNNTRVVNNNVNNVSNVSNVSNVNNVRNVDERNVNNQTRIDNRREQVAPAAMSMPHFTASDARPGAMPSLRAQETQQKMALTNLHAQPQAQKEAVQAAGARPHQEAPQQAQREQQEQRQLQQQQQEQRAQKEQQAAREREQAQQNAAQQARQQAEERKAQAMKQENAHPQMQAHAAAAAPREERPPQHEQKAAPERHEAIAHAQEAHAQAKHEPAKHEEDKRANDKHEGEKHEGEKHNG